MDMEGEGERGREGEWGERGGQRLRGRGGKDRGGREGREGETLQPLTGYSRSRVPKSLQRANTNLHDSRERSEKQRHVTRCHAV